MKVISNKNRMEITVGSVRFGVNYTNGFFWYPLFCTDDYDFDFVTQKTYYLCETFFLNYHFYFGREAGRFNGT